MLNWLIFIILIFVLATSLPLLSGFRRRARRNPAPEANKFKPQIEMVGRLALVTKPLSQGHEGLIEVEGELWLARLVARDGTGWPAELEAGSQVRVVEQRDLLLLVEPLPSEPQGWKLKDEG